MVKIGIIGNAMRFPPYKDLILDVDLFNKMVSKVETIITQELGYTLKDVILVSGGSAWSDHVAIHLYLKYKCELHLYLTSANPKKYHNAFKEQTGINSLKELDTIVENPNVVVKHGQSHNARNRMLAKGVDVLIVLSIDDEAPPTSAIIKYIWDQVQCEKIYVPIRNL